MTPPEPPAPTVETLLPYAGFMRRLAGHIAGNEADAADLEQEAWLAAMRRPPRAEGAIRTWLGIVMGNRRRQQLRGASRVGRRERAAARPEGQGETPDQMLARAETQRVLVEAVLALPELSPSGKLSIVEPPFTHLRAERCRQSEGDSSSPLSHSRGG